MPFSLDIFASQICKSPDTRAPNQREGTVSFPPKDQPLRRDVGWLGHLLGKLLQELGDLDHALAASQAFDLSRNLLTAQGLKELIQGYHTIQQELTNNRTLTNNQLHTIQIALRTLGQNISKLSKN